MRPQTRTLVACIGLLAALHRAGPVGIARAGGTTPGVGGTTGKDTLGDALPKGALTRLGTRRLRAGARSVTFSPDGKYLVSCVGYGGTVRLWDRATGTEVRFEGEPFDMAGGNSVAFSPDGRRIASIVFRNRGTASLWGVCIRDLPSGRVCATALGIDPFLRNLRFSPDGKFLATGSALLNPDDLSVKCRLKAKRHCPWSMALSPDGKLLATGGGSGGIGIPGEKSIWLWDTATGKLVTKLEGHCESVESLVFSPDGKTLASSSLDRTIRFWNVATRRQLRQIEDGRDLPVQITYSPNGKMLAVVYHVGPVHLRFWDSATGKPIRLLPDCRGNISSIAFSPDGKLLLVGGIGHTLQLWDLKTGKQVFSYPGHQSAVLCVRFSPDGKMLASRGADRTVRLWDPAIGKERRRLCGREKGFLSLSNLDPYDGTLAWSPDGKLLAATDNATSFQSSRVTYLWNLASGIGPTEIHDPAWPPLGLAFAPDGKTLGTAAGYVRLWSIASREEQRLLANPGRGRTATITFSPDGHTLVTGSPRWVTLWGGTGYRLLRTWKAHENGCILSRFSSGGQTFVSCGAFVRGTGDKIVRLWETGSGTLIRGREGRDFHDSIALSPNGRLAAFSEHNYNPGSRFCEIVLWDVVNDRELARLKGHEGSIFTLDFSPDGNILASGSVDTTILLWDLSPFRVKLPPTHTDDKTLARLWAQLEGREAAKPYQALWTLAGAGDAAVAFLDHRLRPVPASDSARLRRLLAGLEDNDFDARTAATKELARLGPVALPALRRALAAKPKFDLRRRLQDLIEQIEVRSLSEPDLRQVRALHVLEQIGSPSARRLLGKLARGAPEALLTRDALAALNRLKRTTPP